MKKGFTLIELLAVIIILAIIALIATPVILNVVNSAKEAARKSQLSLYADSIKLQLTGTYLTNNGKYSEVIDLSDTNLDKSVTCEEAHYTKDSQVLLGNCTIKSHDGNYWYINGDVSNEKPSNFDTLIFNSIASSGEMRNVVNPPELLNSMVPVTYENGNWIYTDTNEKWYDYDNKEWANAVVLNVDNATDQSSNNNDGVVYGANQQLDSKLLDGVDDYINLGLTNYNFKNKVTFAVRFKIHTLNTAQTQHLLGNWESGGGGIYVLTNNHIRSSFYIDGSYKYVTSSTPVEKDKYYTVVSTYDGASIKLYVNGELQGTSSTTGDIALSSVALAIGANINLTTIYGYANASVSDVAIYTKPLTETQIIDNFSSDFGLINENLLLKYDFSSMQGIKVGNTIPLKQIGAMFVWIPRYKYTIFNGNDESANPQEINIAFESGSNSTGTIVCNNAVSASGTISEICSDSTNGSIVNGTSTYTHPAFCFGNKTNGICDGTELTGIWVGKFENSTIDTTCNNNQNAASCNNELPIIIKPNVKIWQYAAISRFYTSISNISSRYAIDGDSHMMKNIEWGVVAYLSNSKYGLCSNGDCPNIAKNDSSSVYTGRSQGILPATSDYNPNGSYAYHLPLGWLASTTGNIYGIYDMNGGGYEYVMGNMVNSSNQFYNSNANFSTVPLNKYYDAYTYDSSSYTTHSRGKLGDATKETLQTYGSELGGWYNQSVYFPESTNPWIIRGGQYNHGNESGIFRFGRGTGMPNVHPSSRTVLVTE